MRVQPCCPQCGNAMRFEEPVSREALTKPVPVVCDACGIRDEAPMFVAVTHAD